MLIVYESTKGSISSRIITQDHGVLLSFVDNIIYSVSSKWNKLTFLEYAQNDFIGLSMYAGSSWLPSWKSFVSTKISDTLSKYNVANAIIHFTKNCHFQAEMIDLKMAVKYSVT